MNEIKVAENKTLKLTNVVARRIAPEELGNMMPSRSARPRSMPRSCT